MKNIAYLRISTAGQDLEGQKLAIMEYCNKERLHIDSFEKAIISTRKNDQRAQLEGLIDSMSAGDLLIVSEISRVGRSLGAIVTLVDRLVKKKINFISIKEGLQIENGNQDMQSKMMLGMFGLFAEIERDLISQRTKEGLAKAKERGRVGGRRKGQKVKSKLDGREDEIKAYRDKGLSFTAISKLLDVSFTTLRHFMKSRGL